MICPNCKTKYPSGHKFCSACEDENGMPIRLVEEQQTAGDVNLELGDANAISGGINVSDSHNVHNEDKSVHNINQVTNNITQFAAQKTEMEILQEKKKRYREACVVAFVDDYKIDEAESLALDKLRMELGLEKDIAESILHEVKNVYGQQARQTHLNPIAQKKLDIFSENLKKNNVDVLREQIGSMEALVNRFEHEELTRKYFLVLAALMPEKCISMKEASKTDSYWKSYWSYLAYLKKGNINMAESVLMNLDRFADYPEDNTSLLAVAGALMTGNIVDAKSYLETVTGEFSPELRFFADSIFKCLDPEMVQVEDETVLRFYLTNFFKDNCTQEGTPQECTIPYSFDDDHGTFTGLAIDGIPVKGVFKVDDGATFEGEFKDGAPYKGIVTGPNGGTFEGEFKDGAPYNGTINNFFIEEEGTLTGNLVDGVLKGYGRMNQTGGGSFEGEFKDNEPYNGIISDFVMDDGDTLTGKLVNGQLEGYAKVCHKDGSRFEGEVKNGEPYNGKLFDMVMDDGQKKDVVLSEGKICIDQEEREEQRRKEKEKRKAEEEERKCKVADSEIVPCKYDSVGRFQGRLAKVTKDGKCGIIDKTGREIVPCKYDSVGRFEGGLAIVKKDGKYGYIDKTGREIVPCKYDGIGGGFNEGLARVKKDGKLGYVDKTGREIVPCKYDVINLFSDGFAPVMMDGKWGFIDKTGREIVPCKYQWADNFCCGSIGVVKKDGKHGYIEIETGRVIVPCKYDSAIHNTLGPVLISNKDGKRGYIGETGHETESCKYDIICAFCRGIAKVMKDGKWGCIDKTGREIEPFK